VGRENSGKGRARGEEKGGHLQSDVCNYAQKDRPGLVKGRGLKKRGLRGRCKEDALVAIPLVERRGLKESEAYGGREDVGKKNGAVFRGGKGG